jgi:hypothetical protein
MGTDCITVKPPPLPALLTPLPSALTMTITSNGDDDSNDENCRYMTFTGVPVSFTDYFRFAG